MAADTEHDQSAAATPDTHGRAVAGEGKDKGKHKGGALNGPHREMILVITSVVGVGLTFLLLRRSSGGGAAQATAGSTLSPAVAAGGGQVAGFDSNAMTGLQTMLSNLSDQVLNLNANGPAAAGPLTPSTPATMKNSSGLYKVAGSKDGFYWLDADAGTRDWLSGAEVADMGGPSNAIALAANNAVWRGTKLVGAEFGDSAKYFPSWDADVPHPATAPVNQAPTATTK